MLQPVQTSSPSAFSLDDLFAAPEIPYEPTGGQQGQSSALAPLPKVGIAEYADCLNADIEALCLRSTHVLDAAGQQWLPARPKLRPEMLALHKPVAQAQFEGVVGGRRLPAPKRGPVHANDNPAAVVSRQPRQVQPDFTPTPHCGRPDMIATEWADSSSDNESVGDPGPLRTR